MATLIVDIETKSTTWADLPGITRSSLTHWIDKSSYSEEEKTKKRNEVKVKLSFSPFTASIISLAVYDIERKTGAVYFVSDTPDESFVIDDFTYKQRTEKEILEDFWEGANSYDTFVTFNGRNFTLPFLRHRSGMLQVRPTVDIEGSRYVTKQSLPYHIDLLDEFSFHGAMAHRPSLPLLCGTYGISNSSLLAGEDIDEAFIEKRFRYIAEKNAGDVQAITLLYEKWKDYLAPRSFLNKTEF
jgi:DNA polymerase III epsilon subunit-like protein